MKKVTLGTVETSYDTDSVCMYMRAAKSFCKSKAKNEFAWNPERQRTPEGVLRENRVRPGSTRTNDYPRDSRGKVGVRVFLRQLCREEKRGRRVKERCGIISHTFLFLSYFLFFLFYRVDSVIQLFHCYLISLFELGDFPLVPA